MNDQAVALKGSKRIKLENNYPALSIHDHLWEADFPDALTALIKDPAKQIKGENKNNGSDESGKGIGGSKKSTAKPHPGLVASTAAGMLTQVYNNFDKKIPPLFTGPTDTNSCRLIASSRGPKKKLTKRTKR
ncbi:hypothetical protein [Roseibium hamelinense]|uniref:hypothetical protein n=1 Tax=Roseibium hamelinense TaxID=150831 RepID=UPI0011A4E5FF|nr:hypothetical protein [Roseibium hamelinense]